MIGTDWLARLIELENGGIKIRCLTHLSTTSPRP